MAQIKETVEAKLGKKITHKTEQWFTSRDQTRQFFAIRGRQNGWFGGEDGKEREYSFWHLTLYNQTTKGTRCRQPILAVEEMCFADTGETATRVILQPLQSENSHGTTFAVYDIDGNLHISSDSASYIPVYDPQQYAILIRDVPVLGELPQNINTAQAIAQFLNKFRRLDFSAPRLG